MEFIIFVMLCFAVAMWLPGTPQVDKFAQLATLIRELWGAE